MNIEQLVTSPTTTQAFASRVIDQSKDSTLATLGGCHKRKSILTGKQPNCKKPLFAADDLALIKKDLNLRLLVFHSLIHHLQFIH